MLQEIPAAIFQDMGAYGGLQVGGSDFGQPASGPSTVGAGSRFSSQIMPDINSLAVGEPARGLLLAYMQELKKQFQFQNGIDQYVHGELGVIRGMIESHPGFQSMMN